MNLTVKLFLQDLPGSVLTPAGAVSEVYDADQVATWDGTQYKLNNPPRLNKPFGYVHIRNYPHDISLQQINAVFQAPAEHESTVIRSRNWLADLSAFSGGAAQALATTREHTVDGSDGAVMQYLRWLEIESLNDPQSDSLGRAITLEDLTGGNP